jgi:hypothetical protein
MMLTNAEIGTSANACGVPDLLASMVTQGTTGQT